MERTRGERGRSRRAPRCPIRRRCTCCVPKWLTARARASSERARQRRCAGSFLARVRARLLGVHLRACCTGCCAYFRGVPEIGPLLAGKLLGLILVGFFSILLLSNIITALSSFFLARDLDLLVSAPVDWLQALSGEADRDARALELDGGADGRADLRGVRRGLRRRAALSADRRSRRSCRFSSCRRSSAARSRWCW